MHGSNTQTADIKPAYTHTHQVCTSLMKTTAGADLFLAHDADFTSEDINTFIKIAKTDTKHGILTLVANNIRTREIEMEASNKAELLGIVIHLPDRKFTIYNYYATPERSKQSSLGFEKNITGSENTSTTSSRLERHPSTSVDKGFNQLNMSYRHVQAKPPSDIRSGPSLQPSQKSCGAKDLTKTAEFAKATGLQMRCANVARTRRREESSRKL
ncbi:hypothetical protein PoB_002827000 [Plakobranchus ocellatus]|uniref:Uncharacterized protein n=1 Tax=Plakobranchus ocellatus TaxID=259542 RepID=A0AAV4A0T6_9GAST|nr:hypothetical protein PoB_002827000 [Plakobranchus ocellatus]